MPTRTTIIDDELAAVLAAIPAAVAIHGGRVYPFAGVPQNAAWPHQTYHQVGGGRMGSTEGPTTGVSHPRYQVDSWGRTFRAARRLADATRLYLDGLGGAGPVTWGGRTVRAVLVTDPRDLSEDPPHGDEVSEYRVSIDVTIWFDEE